MVQFHALGLLYHIRSSDRLAVNKLVQKWSKTFLRSPFATCYLIRLAGKLIEEDEAGLAFTNLVASNLRSFMQDLVFWIYDNVRSQKLVEL